MRPIRRRRIYKYTHARVNAPTVRACELSKRRRVVAFSPPLFCLLLQRVADHGVSGWDALGRETCRVGRDGRNKQAERVYVSRRLCFVYGPEGKDCRMEGRPDT